MNINLKNAEGNKPLFYSIDSIAGCKFKNVTKFNCANCLRGLRADPTAYEAIKNSSCDEETINRNIVYICSPLRGDIVRNQNKALGYCRFVISKGFIPMSTHLIFPQFMDDCDEKDREKTMEMCLEILSRCDELWCFGEKFSEGMAREMDFAKKYKIKIRCFTDLCDPLPQREA